VLLRSAAHARAFDHRGHGSSLAHLTGLSVWCVETFERYFLQGFHRWHIEWIEVISVGGIVLPTDPVLMSLQTIVGLVEDVRAHA